MSKKAESEWAAEFIRVLREIWEISQRMDAKKEK